MRFGIILASACLTACGATTGTVSYIKCTGFVQLSADPDDGYQYVAILRIDDVNKTVERQNDTTGGWDRIDSTFEGNQITTREGRSLIMINRQSGHFRQLREPPDGKLVYGWCLKVDEDDVRPKF